MKRSLNHVALTKKFISDILPLAIKGNLSTKFSIHDQHISLNRTYFFKSVDIFVNG